MLSDLYEMRYGIFNHKGAGNSRPLSSVAFHPSENINTDSLLESAIRTYVKRGIKDLYGLTLVEYLELPMDLCEMLLKLADEELATKTRAMASLESQLKQ